MASSSSSNNSVDPKTQLSKFNRLNLGQALSLILKGIMHHNFRTQNRLMF